MWGEIWGTVLGGPGNLTAERTGGGEKGCFEVWKVEGSDSER